MKYRVAVNMMALDGKLPQGDHRWAQFNDSFVNQEIELFDFANAVYMGQAYTAWHNGRRKDENFLCGQHIAVDMETHDERSSIPYLLDMEFVQVYAALIYSTPSHTDADPRSRVVFLLDQPIDDPAAYEVAISFVYSQFPGSDPSCVDSSRFFYGSKNCTLEWFPNQTLPLTHLRSYYNRWRKWHEQPTTKTKYAHQPTATTAATKQPGILTPDSFLTYAINDASGQGRNNRGYRLARQLREMGLSQWETEGYMRRYQQAVASLKGEPYTESEALASMKSAYRGMH